MLWLGPSVPSAPSSAVIGKVNAVASTSLPSSAAGSGPSTHGAAFQAAAVAAMAAVCAGTRRLSWGPWRAKNLPRPAPRCRLFALVNDAAAAAAAAAADAAATAASEWDPESLEEEEEEPEPQVPSFVPASTGTGPPTEEELGDWCALYINLARRPDRKSRLEALLGKANGPVLERLERVDAIDCQQITLDDEDVQENVRSGSLERARRAQRFNHYTIVHDGTGNLVHFDDHLTLGGIACALSHRKALQRLATHPTAKWGLILEDDVKAVVPRVDLSIALVLRQISADWDAVCLAYHDPRGRVHPAAAAEPNADGTPSEPARSSVIRSTGHCFGLGAWMVSKEAAKSLVDNAFPIASQVDYTLTNFLACQRRRFWKLDPTNLLFYAPSSEEDMDSDVQTMVSLEQVERQHQTLNNYLDHLNGRSLQSELDQSLLDYYGEEMFDEEQYLREWQAERYGYYIDKNGEYVFGSPEAEGEAPEGEEEPWAEEEEEVGQDVVR